MCGVQDKNVPEVGQRLFGVIIVKVRYVVRRQKSAGRPDAVAPDRPACLSAVWSCGGVQLQATCSAQTEGPAMPGVHEALLFATMHLYSYFCPTVPGHGL